MMESDSDLDDPTVDLLHIDSDDDDISESAQAALPDEGHSSGDEFKLTDNEADSSDSDHYFTADEFHDDDQTLPQSGPGDDSESSGSKDHKTHQQHSCTHMLPSPLRSTSSAGKSKGGSQTSEVPKKWKKQRARVPPALDRPRSSDEHEATGSELQLYSQPLPGTSGGISPIGGSISTGTRQLTKYISDKQAKDIVKKAVASSGWDTAVDTQDNREDADTLREGVCASPRLCDVIGAG